MSREPIKGATPEMLSLPRSPGVYLITSADTGHRYVGASANMRSRALAHLGMLQHGNAASRVQASCGDGQNIRFAILEECSISDLDSRESFWIEKLNPEMNTTGTDRLPICPPRKPFRPDPGRHLFAVYADDADARKQVWAKSREHAERLGAALFNVSDDYIIARYIKSINRPTE